MVCVNVHHVNCAKSVAIHDITFQPINRLTGKTQIVGHQVFTVDFIDADGFQSGPITLFSFVEKSSERINVRKVKW